ncbi:MAG: hypothetical protein FD152_3933 [Xanthobacteraceae bacterium]|nr:MAG: hypothetical protein FD152_3933 [Xanthobacteraceae bacterium]
MTRPLMHRSVPALAAAALIIVMAPSDGAQATPFWFGWAGHERPVVYRPVVTPRTYYFQPAETVRIVPSQPRHRHHRGHRAAR